MTARAASSNGRYVCVGPEHELDATPAGLQLGSGALRLVSGKRTTWLLGTQSSGYWRTTDSGATRIRVSTTNMQHGGTAAYVSKSGVLYVGALSNVLRSTDDGFTFSAVASHTSDGYYAIIGDGNFLYTQFWLYRRQR
jgi:hypothetical protein